MSDNGKVVAAARAFDSQHGCGSIGRCEICMADFAREYAKAEREKVEAYEAALTGIRDMPEYDQDDVLRLRHIGERSPKGASKMTDEQRDALNRFIHTEVMGREWKPVLTGDGVHDARSMQSVFPDYTRDLNTCRLAELKVIEMVGMDAYGRALTNRGFESGEVVDNMSHGKFMVMAAAEQRCQAIRLAVEEN